jgi:hypothetical protein
MYLFLKIPLITLLAYKDIMNNGKFYVLQSNSSEDVASFVHFLLTFSPARKPEIPPPLEETET